MAWRVPRREFNESEIAYIKQWAGKAGIRSIATRLETSDTKISQTIAELKLPVCTGISVTPPEYEGVSSRTKPRKPRKELKQVTGGNKRKRVFNEQEIAYIKENAGKSGINSLARQLQTSGKMVSDIMNQYNLPRSRPGAAVEAPTYTGISSRSTTGGRKRKKTFIRQERKLEATFQQREKDFVPMLRVSIESGEVQYFGEGLR